MKKNLLFGSIAVTFLTVTQNGIANNYVPHVVCGDPDPIFSYAVSSMSSAVAMEDNQYYTRSYMTGFQTFPILLQNSVNYFSCAIINYQPVFNNISSIETPRILCGGEFTVPAAAVNLLNIQFEKDASFHSDKHLFVLNIQLTPAIQMPMGNSGSDNSGGSEQYFQACASVNYYQ